MTVQNDVAVVELGGSLGPEIMLYNYDRSKELNIHPYVSGFDIEESIDNSNYTAVFYISEGIDLIENFPLRGEEWIEITFNTPTFPSKTYKFFVQSVIAQKPNEMSINNFYVLSCTSEGDLANSKTLYTKRYGFPTQKKYHEIIDEILMTDWPAGASLAECEQTEGFFDYICNQVRPLQAIDLIRERAVSKENKSSIFKFFQDHDGYHFVTPEFLTDRPIHGPYVLDTSNRLSVVDTINYNNILSFTVFNQGRTIESIKSGSMRNLIKEFDIFTGSYANKYEYVPDDYKSYKKFGEETDFHSDIFNSDVSTSPGTIRYVVKDGTRYDNKHNENIHWKRPYQNRLDAYTVAIRIYGDTRMNIGDQAELDLPQIAYNDADVPRELFSGKFLIRSMKQVFYIREDGSFNHFSDIELTKAHLGGS